MGGFEDIGSMHTRSEREPCSPRSSAPTYDLSARGALAEDRVRACEALLCRQRSLCLVLRTISATELCSTGARILPWPNALAGALTPNITCGVEATTLVTVRAERRVLLHTPDGHGSDFRRPGAGEPGDE